MSRGFVKEDDQEETPFIPPRAPLPANATNYVTQRGFQALKTEKAELEKEREHLDAENDKERRLSLAVINGKLSLIEERILSAQLIKAENQPLDEVRFGATVTSKVLSGKQKGIERTFTIVGVDESNVRQRRVAFTAPIAKVLLGSKKGEQVNFQLGGETQILQIVEFHYREMI